MGGREIERQTLKKEVVAAMGGKCNALLMADRVIREDNGKRGIIGSFNTFTFPTVPATAPPFFVYANIEDFTGELEFSITIAREGAELVVFSAGGEIKFQDDTVKQKMDGVIIATPSGSTGHSFSLGGPILHESLDVLIITPVAPVYRLESIVVPDEKIEIISSQDCSIVMDAQVVKSVGYGEPIIIKKYRKPAVFVRLKKRGLRQMSKLGF